MIRILVTGSRIGIEYAQVARELTLAIYDFYEPNKSGQEIKIIHGNCHGTDLLASEFCNKISNSLPGCRITQEKHPVTQSDFKKYGNKAYFLRNKKMVDLGADRVLVFNCNNSKGATMTKTLALNAGLDVKECLCLHINHRS